jgi:hypothetical protein
MHDVLYRVTCCIYNSYDMLHNTHLVCLAVVHEVALNRSTRNISLRLYNI